MIVLKFLKSAFILTIITFEFFISSEEENTIHHQNKNKEDLDLYISKRITTRERRLHEERERRRIEKNLSNGSEEQKEDNKSPFYRNVVAFSPIPVADSSKVSSIKNEAEADDEFDGDPNRHYVDRDSPFLKLSNLEDSNNNMMMNNPQDDHNFVRSSGERLGGKKARLAAAGIVDPRNRRKKGKQ